MTSSNGNIFRVTGHLCGEFIGPLWIPRTKASDAERLMFSLICVWINGWLNNREAGDLRRYRAHYDVIVMEGSFSMMTPCHGKAFRITGPLGGNPPERVSDVKLWHCFFVSLLLTHWGRDKMAAISQTTFSNTFSWLKMYEFRLRFHWSLLLRVQLTIFHHWFR